MSTKALLKNYAEATTELKVAESEAARLKARSDDLASRLLSARLASASLNTEIEQFATDESVDALVKRAESLARDLASKRSESEGVIRLLEQALNAAQDAHAHAKMRIVSAEIAVIKTTKAYYAALLDEQMGDFLRSIRPTLQRLTSTVHIHSSLPDGPHQSIEAARTFAVFRADQVCEDYLLPALTKYLEDDRDFHATVGTAEKGAPNYPPQRSSEITADERTRLIPLLIKGTMTSADIIKALTPESAEEAQLDSPVRINDQCRYFAQRVGSLKSQIEDAEKREYRSDLQKQEAIDGLKVSLTRAEECLANWQNMQQVSSKAA